VPKAMSTGSDYAHVGSPDDLPSDRSIEDGPAGDGFA